MVHYYLVHMRYVISLMNNQWDRSRKDEEAMKQILEYSLKKRVKTMMVVKQIFGDWCWQLCLACNRFIAIIHFIDWPWVLFSMVQIWNINSVMVLGASACAIGVPPKVKSIICYILCLLRIYDVVNICHSVAFEMCWLFICDNNKVICLSVSNLCARHGEDNKLE